jgi:hypothetical protein
MSNTPKSSRDHLTASTKEGKIELMEQELNRVTGGAVDTFRTHTIKKESGMLNENDLEKVTGGITFVYGKLSIGSATGGAGGGKAEFN